MPAKRHTDGDAGAPLPAKASRSELHLEYDSPGANAIPQSSTHARRKGASNRTGQACDRCKIRKIRCDPQPGGCSPCAQNNTECRTTDRITGLARSRGHTESLEGECASLRAHVESLEKQLKEKGFDPVHPPNPPSAYATDTYPSPTQREQPAASWGSLQQPPPTDTSAPQPPRLTEFRAGCIGDNYLGVSSGNNWLSPIEGSSLSLFGATLDLAEFIPEESLDSGTSYQNFLDHAFIEQQKNAPQLPDYDQAKMYAEWYFRSVQPMLPIVHKPHFMHLLHRVYNEQYQPTAAELVMVHMVISMVMFQYNTRNTASPTRVQNFQHWHFSLSLVPRLMKGDTLPDMQGLVLICGQLRAFPRPGACWMFTNTVLGLAIERGLHRSVNAFKESNTKQDPHDVELRKRIFWCLMMLHVPVSGKLGRPMPLRLQDFDIEIPEEAHDIMPDESHFEEWRKCSFRSGVWGFVLIKVLMKVYSTIYTIGGDAKYEANVKLLEVELKETLAKVPPELSGGSETKVEDRVTALYLQLMGTGCQLLIHHPALCRSMSPQVVSDNIDACLDASNKMLSLAVQLKALGGLDTTLYWNMDFLASMFTMLFAYHERRDRLTVLDVQRLRQSMQSWLDVMGSVGALLGSGDRLQSTLRNLVEWSISQLKRHLDKKSATVAGASASTPPATDISQQHSQQQSQNQTPVYESGRDYAHSYQNGAKPDITSAHQHTPQQQSAQIPQPTSSAGYPTSQAYSYAESQPSTTLAYSQPYNPQSYPAEDAKPDMSAQLAAQAALAQQQQQQQQQQTHTVTAPSAQAYNMPLYQTASGYPIMDSVGPMAWRSFAENMVTGMHTSAPPGSAMAPDASLTSYAAAGMMPGQDPALQSKNANGSGSGNGNSAFMYANGASFGQMQMPPQDGAVWPLVQFQ